MRIFNPFAGVGSFLTDIKNSNTIYAQEINSKTWAIGHTRLSIIDIEKGSQPIFSKDKRYAMVFNGEIYNYKELKSDLEAKGVNFFTNSDTEVLLESYIFWGKNFLDKINGMYAFAIYDFKLKKL